MHLVDEEQFDEPYKLLVIFPFAGHTVPLLWCRNDDICILDIVKRSSIGVSSQLLALQTKKAESRLPISSPLRTQSLGWSHVYNLERSVLPVIDKATYSKLEHSGLAAASRR